MTLRLGFVGTGKWGRKLAESFRACGAEVVAFDREAVPTSPHFWPPGFGVYTPWREQLERKDIDAIVAVAPPEITTEVVLAAAAVGKAVMGTKPLWDHPRDLTAPVYVDLWRLYSKTHRTARERLAADKRAPLCINLYGNGPFRSFPGAFDWGPHVVAAVADLVPGCRLSGAAKINHGDGETFRSHFHGPDPRTITLYFGNAKEGPTERSYMVGDWRESEDGERIGTETKVGALQSFCRAFMSDVSEGFVSDRLVKLSRDGMRLIEQVRSQAT